MGNFSGSRKALRSILGDYVIVGTMSSEALSVPFLNIHSTSAAFAWKLLVQSGEWRK